MSWAETCSRCGNDRLWWRSRTGYLVCMVCARDPLDALETLARRASTAVVRRVQTWRQAATRQERPPCP
jgi:hypothetical protein